MEIGRRKSRIADAIDDRMNGVLSKRRLSQAIPVGNNTGDLEMGVVLVVEMHRCQCKTKVRTDSKLGPDFLLETHVHSMTHLAFGGASHPYQLKIWWPEIQSADHLQDLSCECRGLQHSPKDIQNFLTSDLNITITRCIVVWDSLSQ